MTDFKKFINSYIFETDLPGSGRQVTFKPITTGQIKRLLLYETSNDADSIERSLDNIITECVVDDDFNIDELYLQDRFYLLLDLRKATKGNTYSFQSKCSKCESQSAQAVNLSSLEVKKLAKPLVPVEIVVPVKQKKSKVVTMKKGGTFVDEADIKDDLQKQLPVSLVQQDDRNIVKLNDNLSIRLSYLTRKLQKEAIAYINNKVGLTDDQKRIEETTLQYAVAITSVITPEGEDSNLTMEDKIYIIEEIPQNEMEKISKWYNDNDFGVDFSFDVVCAHCDNKERKAIPLESFFF